MVRINGDIGACQAPAVLSVFFNQRVTHPGDGPVTGSTLFE